MLGSFVNTIKSRLSTRANDDAFRSTDCPRAQNIFMKLVNASYALVSQTQDDAYCSDNLFMLPRVYSQKSENVSGLWSPISLKPPEKQLDELDSVVEKFIRCISLENRRDDANVNEIKNVPPTLHLSSLTNWLMNSRRSCLIPEEKWSRSDSTTVGDGRGRRLLHRFSSVTTHPQAQLAVTTSERLASLSDWHQLGNLS